MATSHGHGEPNLAGPTHDLGYEPDRFAVKTILAVPAAIIITGVLAFVVTTVLFDNIFSPRAVKVEPTFPEAAAANAVPLDQRLGRISSDDPAAPVQQPRLEGLVERKTYYKDDAKDKGDVSNQVTPEMVPTQPTEKGNSPRYHAEDLRPEKSEVLSTRKVDPQTGAVVRIPVDQAIDRVSSPNEKAWAAALPVRKGARPLEEAWNRPKESNGGNARWPLPAKSDRGKKEAAPKGGPGGKEPETKGPQPKQPENNDPKSKDAEKKEPEKKEPGKK